MGRKVYTPQRERTFHNGKFYEGNSVKATEEIDFCNVCDAVTLHLGGLCVRCYPKRTSQITEQNKIETKSSATNNKKSS